MSEKHTKGPWKATGNHVSAKIKTVDGSFVHPTIALINQTTTSAQANVNLIAAAPEMLEALEAIVESKALANKKHVDIATKMIRAILKARGEK